MNNIWSIYVVSVVALIMFGGIAMIGDYAFERGLLSDESTISYLAYNSQWVELSDEGKLMKDQLYANGTSRVELDPDVNAIESFVREYAEAKSRIGVLRNSMRLITNVPGMLFISLPFVEYDDVKYYNTLLFITILVSVGIATFKALFQRRVDEK